MGDPILASNIILLDGNNALPQTLITCGHCHDTFNPTNNDMDQQHWTDWFMKKE